jgi:hypothetical protein
LTKAHGGQAYAVAFNEKREIALLDLGPMVNGCGGWISDYKKYQPTCGPNATLARVRSACYGHCITGTKSRQNTIGLKF